MSRLASQLIQPPPGVPVAKLLLKGRVSLGFQQASELAGIDGIEVIGSLPAGARIETLFNAVPVLESRTPHVAQAVRDCIAYRASPATAQAKQRYFLSPA